MNDFNNINGESEFRNEMTVQSNEPSFSVSGSMLENDDRMYPGEEETPYYDLVEEPYDGGGWPGDGSGTDDLADFNANEADDYGPDEDRYSDGDYNQ